MHSKKTTHHQPKDHNPAEADSGIENESEASTAEAKQVDDALLDKCRQFEDKYLRALADYQNLVKRTAEDKQETAKYANEQLLHEILPVYDNLKMSMLHVGKDHKSSWLEGIIHVIRQFKDVLERSGIEEIKTEGEKFDHHTMEAIDKALTTDPEKDGRVFKEQKAGYKLNGKVISTARVVVYELNK